MASDPGVRRDTTEIGSGRDGIPCSGRRLGQCGMFIETRNSRTHDAGIAEKKRRAFSDCNGEPQPASCGLFYYINSSSSRIS